MFVLLLIFPPYQTHTHTCNFFKKKKKQDNGTGYTKMGYAGNVAPQYVIPTLMATPQGAPGTALAGGDVRNTEGKSCCCYYYKK